MGQKRLDRIRERDDVGVPDDHELGSRIHVLEGYLQRPALEPVAALPVDQLEAGPALPMIPSP